VSNSRVLVDWQHFLTLYCTFEQGQMDKAVLIRFWQKFFDPFNSGKCVEREYMALLEEIIRGQMIDKPNPTTNLFAEMYQRQLKSTGCLGPDSELLMDKYKEAFEQNKLDLQLLCSALGGQEINSDFMD
jgi:hypothetical protein